MVGIVLEVELQDELARQKLADLVARMNRPIGFYKGVGEYLVGIAIPRNFSSEAAPDGTLWARLRPLTVRRREAKGQTPIAILKATGKMASEINYRAADDGVVVGSPAAQAAVMHGGASQGQFGAHIGRTRPSEKRPRSQDYFMPLPWGDIPARPFLGLSEADEAEIIRIAEDWLEVE